MKELTYHRHFFPAMNNFSDNIVVVDGAYQATMQQHGDRVLRLGNAIKTQLGIGKGDRFAVMAVNCHEYLELYHAAYLGAGVINTLNLRLAGKELEYIIRDSGSEVVFVDDYFADALAQAMQASDEKSPIRKTVLIGKGDGSHDLRYEDLLATGTADVLPETEEEDPVVLMYTGGTTGLPKGVLVNQRAETLNWYHVGMVLGYRSDEVFLLQTPIFHAASMVTLLALPVAGGKLVLMPMFEPEGAINLIEEHQVSQTMMVPTMIGLMLNHPSYKAERISSLRQLVYGASPMPVALLDRLLEMFPDLELSQGYGMTESASVLTWLGVEEHRERGDSMRSVGRAVPGVELCIQNADGDLLPLGETGEVCAKGGNYMTEYWNQPEATKETFRGGWYHTGDAGYLDEDGYLYLVDRVKDMIVSGGENVYSVEVENAISTHEAVAQVAVIGIPDDVWGEAVHAIVVCLEGAEVTGEQIIEHAREEIAGYKVPKSVEFRGEPLPLSGALKVLKRELRKPFWEGKGKFIG
jgi:long-chain acyl-CoA synthetase